MEGLKNLPSRGKFITPKPGAIICSQPSTYIAAHDTAPPDTQVVKSNATNILIRSLINNKNKETEARKKQAKEKAGKKRAAEAPAGTSARKRPNNDAAVEEEGAPAVCYSPQQLRGKSNQELIDILKTMRKPAKGRKDDLIQRILNGQANRNT